MARTVRSRLAVAGALGAVAVTLGGCSFLSPIQTLDPYAPSDGVRVEVADGVFIENLLIVAADEGEPGRVLGAVNNETDDDVDLTISFPESGEDLSVTADANGLANFTDEDLILADTPVAPGGTAAAEVSTLTGGGVPVQVPVLDDTHEHYAEYIPGE